jgi:hypothetical protein
VDIDTLQVFGDSKIVIDWLNFRGNLQVISLVGWKDRIRELTNTFSTIRFSHIFGNKIGRLIHYPKRLYRIQKGR